MKATAASSTWWHDFYVMKLPKWLGGYGRKRIPSGPIPPGSEMYYSRGPWWFTIYVGEAYRIPTGYGFAWYEPWSNSGIFAPFGLNFFYAGLQHLNRWLVQGWWDKDRYDRALAKAYQAGRQAAWESAQKELDRKFTYAQMCKAYHQGMEHQVAWIQVNIEREAYAAVVEEMERRTRHERKH